MLFRWLSPVFRSGLFRYAFVAGWLLTGAASIASAQSSSNTRQLLLFDAVRQNNLEQVRSIISAGIDVARPNAGGIERIPANAECAVVANGCGQGRQV